MIDLKTILIKYPQCLDSAVQFSSYLKDIYPGNSFTAEIKVLSEIYSLGILECAPCLQIDAIEINKIKTILISQQGYDETLVSSCISLWADALSNISDKSKFHKCTGDVDSNLSIGDTVFFGECSQTVSGEIKKIEWIVIDKDQHGICLLSKYALFCKEFNCKLVNINWETSSLRYWLNHDFYSTSFSAIEKLQIRRTYINSISLAESNKYLNCQTNDFIFLLSSKEANELNNLSIPLSCMPTAYAELTGTYCYKKACDWWLRDSGKNNFRAAYVDYDGKVNEDGRGVYGNVFLDGQNNKHHDVQVAVRPALWVDFTANHNAVNVQDSEIVYSKDVINEIKIGANINFGRYIKKRRHFDQESIIWNIVDIKGDNALLVSTEVIDCLLFDNNSSNVWADSELRRWLNVTFYERAFNPLEKNIIITTNVTPNENGKYKIKSGRTTQDNIFILSLGEMEHYYREEEDRVFETSNLVYTKGFDGECWLRTAGANKDLSLFMKEDGSCDYDGADVGFANFGIRPAVWVAISKFNNMVKGEIL